MLHSMRLFGSQRSFAVSLCMTLGKVKTKNSPVCFRTCMSYFIDKQPLMYHSCRWRWFKILHVFCFKSHFLLVILMWSVLIYICTVESCTCTSQQHSTHLLNCCASTLYSLLDRQKFVKCLKAFIMSICFLTVLLFSSSINRNAMWKITFSWIGHGSVQRLAI